MYFIDSVFINVMTLQYNIRDFCSWLYYYLSHQDSVSFMCSQSAQIIWLPFTINILATAYSHQRRSLVTRLDR